MDYKKLIIPGIILLIFFVFKIQYHEFWKDEWQAFLVARDMPFLSMFKFLNYEGHPSLWYVYLKPFTWLSPWIDEPTLLNVAHIIPFVVCVYLITLKFDLHWLVKLLFCLSYFFCFEYGVVNRGYILVELLGILSILYIQQRRIFSLSITLFLLCQTEIYGVILATVLLFFYFLNQKFERFETYIGYFLGLAFFIITVYPRGHVDEFSRAYNQTAFSNTTIANAFQGLLGNVFAIGAIDDTAIYGYSNVGLLISGLILGMLVYLFYEDRKIRFSWMVGAAILYCFSTFVFLGGIRQWGFMYVLFFFMLLLSPTIIHHKIRKIITILLMVAPLLYNLKAMYKEMTMPFSNAKEAGIFISSKIPENVAIVSLNKFETAAAAAYANRKMFELPNGTTFTYFKWLERIYVPTQSELMLFAKYKGAKGLIILSPTPIDPNRFPILKLWKKFDQPNLKSEEFYFYVLDLTGRN